jgi:hypothetical protein
MAPSNSFLLVSLVVLAAQCFRIDVQKYLANPVRYDDDGDFIPFQAFLSQVRSATYQDYSHGVVRNEGAFTEMKEHILNMYAGVGEVTSFVFESSYGDCIAIEEQPTVHQLGLHEIAQPPVNSQHDKKAYGPGPGQVKHADSPLKLGLRDQFGNPLCCPEYAIPMARLTLEKLTRYETLRDFFSKPPGPILPSDYDFSTNEIHRHSYGSQPVTNFGGNSWLDLWSPAGDFSISQHWYYGTAEEQSTQTLEGGWRKDTYDDPNTDVSTLFIYWTADWYKTTGCWNLECPAFVQINNNWYLGGIWDHYSTMDGEQWGFQMQWKLYQGNWWLFLRGPGDIEAVGYYPTSIYNSGQLSQNSNMILYGGEVANYTGGDSFPQMGSGDFAENGFGEAAFQNTIFYIPQDEDDGVGVWAELSAHDESPASCYTIELVDWPKGGDWGTYFYFGGPGGFGCV